MFSKKKGQNPLFFIDTEYINFRKVLLVFDFGMKVVRTLYTNGSPYHLSEKLFRHWKLSEQQNSYRAYPHEYKCNIKVISIYQIARKPATIATYMVS